MDLSRLCRIIRMAEQLVFPGLILYLSTYRDGRTVGVGIKGKKGNHSIEFFLDQF